jgi:hypothetical protein
MAPRGLPIAAAFLAALPLLPSARAEDPPRPKSLSDFLKGAITAFDGEKVEVRYDLVDAAQMEDFRDFKPFQVAGAFVREWYDRSIHLKGTGGVGWKVGLKRRAGMEFEAKMATLRDFGAYISEKRGTEHFTLFSIFDQFFQNKDSPGSPKSHMICRFLPEASDSGGELAFRYVSRTSSPDIEARKPFRVKLAADGNDEWMEIVGGKDDSRLQGKDNWGPPLRGLRPGFYVLDSEAWISDLVLRGEVDPEWAAEAGVDLKIPVKVHRAGGREAERTPTEADIAARDRTARVRAGESPPASLLRTVEDATLLESIREDAARAIEETGDVKLVPRLVPLLESTDLLTRKCGARLLTRLAGKSFGFTPDAAEEARRKAVRSLLDWIEKNPAKFK